AAEAGTADAPEITDPAGDQAAVGVVPVDTAGFATADVVAAWIEEDPASLLFNIQVSGAGTDGSAGPYTWEFICAEIEASGTSSAEQPTPGGAATAAALDSSVITLTVPRDALAGATALTGCHVQTHGGTPLDPDVAVEDTAPDDGADAGIGYEVTGGSAGGAPGDSDGDGLNDTKEQEQFGNLTAQNGTGDPDGDGLNNTEEFGMGTNATKADTDGDGLDDKQDSDPLDPSKPGTGGNGTGNATADLDGDGLPDAWEREHFNSTTAQGDDGDPDSDGLQNSDEYEAGTDPNEPDTDGDGLNDSTDPKPLTAEAEGADRLEMYAGAPMFAAIATLCLFALARR
ncbi:MAG TPA: hypothetical protein VJ874_00795, partial [Candidatus Thermoplasmatota archaeon]|nr:hypothetical protein [Candidatus Thermoplasmatota archaeon]